MRCGQLPGESQPPQSLRAGSPPGLVPRGPGAEASIGAGEPSVLPLPRLGEALAGRHGALALAGPSPGWRRDRRWHRLASAWRRAAGEGRGAQ